MHQEVFEQVTTCFENIFINMESLQNNIMNTNLVKLTRRRPLKLSFDLKG